MGAISRAWLATWRRCSAWFRPERSDPRHALGEAGEDAAARFLEKAGYRVLVRNWRAGRDELDLVTLAPREPGMTGDTLVFVEVKTRSASDSRGGYHAVDARKRAALRRAVRAYLAAVGARSAAFRFDVIEVRREENGSLRVIHHCAAPLFTR